MNKSLKSHLKWKVEILYLTCCEKMILWLLLIYQTHSSISFPIHDSHKRYLAIEFDNKQYVFNFLPFGLTSSPRIFSKVLKPAIVYLRAKGIKISFYLDDIFICNSAKSLLVSHIDQTLTLLKSLGFTPNYAKSNLNPSKLLIHLGYLWNSESMSLFILHD